MDKEIKKEFDKINGTLKGHAGSLEEQSGILNEHSATLKEHTEILNEHTEILNEHSVTLKEHTEILNEHTEILNEHSVTLKEHSEILAEHTKRHDSHDRKFDIIVQVVKENQNQIRKLGVEFEHFRHDQKFMSERMDLLIQRSLSKKDYDAWLENHEHRISALEGVVSMK